MKGVRVVRALASKSIIKHGGSGQSTPLIKGVELRGMGLKKHYKTRGSGQSTPLIKGGEAPPP